MKALIMSSFLVVFLTCLVSVEGADPADDSERQPPSLKFDVLGKAWQKLSLEASKNSIYSPTGDDLFLSCKAPYPIQWNISGDIIPAEIVKIQPPKRDLFDNVFRIKVNVFFLDAEGFSGLAASAIIACESLEDNAIRQEVAVFVKGNNPLVEPLETTVVNSRLIPCPTTDPTTPTSLFLKNNDGTEVLVQDASYNPVKGFESENIFNGIFVCRKGTFAVTVSAVAPDLTSRHQFLPVTDSAIGFADEGIEFQCSSSTNPVSFRFEDVNGTNAVLSKDLERGKIARVYGNIESNEGNNQKLIGKVACFAEIGDGSDLIKEWTYELIQSPEFYIDNYEGEADCLTGHSPKRVQTVRCKNKMECNFMKHCLHDPAFCNFKKQKQFFATADTYCWIGEKNKGKPCASVPFSHFNGIAQCNVMGLTRKWEFFISLDYVRYTNWEDAPDKELVRIEEIKTEGQTKTRKFLCTASAYLFADSLTFQLEYKNGVKELIRGQNESKSNEPSMKLPFSQTARTIYELNIKSFLDMELPKDVVTVNCIAPFWNSTKVLIAKIEAAGALALLIGMEKIKLEKISVGEKNVSLLCISDHRKVWLYSKQNRTSNATDTFPELILEGNGEDKLSLIFPVIEKKHAGQYSCVSLDDETEITRNKVLVIEPLTTSTVTYAGLVIVLLLIAALVVAATTIFLRKRRRVSRSLT